MRVIVSDLKNLESRVLLMLLAQLTPVSATVLSPPSHGAAHAHVEGLVLTPT